MTLSLRDMAFGKGFHLVSDWVVSLVTICMIAAFISSGCTRAGDNTGSQQATPASPQEAGSDDSPGQPPPSKFVQVVGEFGTIDVQIFPTWVIAYTYPTEDHKLLGIAASAKVHANKGTLNSPELGALIAEAQLVNPETFDRKLDYPQVPAEIGVNEKHLDGTQTTFEGRLTFTRRAEISKRTADSVRAGRRSEDYFLFWPMFNYRIEEQMRRGRGGPYDGGVFTIEVDPDWVPRTQRKR